MKSLDILLSILEDAQTQLCANTTRDKKTILSRYEHEGVSFLGITLPYFSEWLEESLRIGKVAPSIYVRFHKTPGGRSVLPSFLHGLTALVFDSKTGLVKSDLNENAVFFIRQICLFHKKVFVVCDPVRDRASQRSYEETDLSLRGFSMPSGDCAVFWHALLDRLMPDLEVAYQSAVADPLIVPKHGPGATADRRWGNDKYRCRDWYSRWSGIFSWEELYGLSTIDQTDGREVKPDEEQPVRVVSVPKTMKASRIICVEPTAMQYAQQLVSARLRHALQVCGIHRQLNFEDQTVNQRLAKQGSMSGEWATIDLSEASDRLHSKVVSRLFSRARTIRQQVFACRTARAQLPDGRCLPLRKYASMGSALTFPVEAFAFYTIVVAALLDFYSREFRDKVRVNKERNTAFIPRDLLNHCKSRVFVFGDDIIVPAESYEVVTHYLQAYGLKVNLKKSFDKGLFRESCGKDWVNGCLVTPVYLRQFHPVSVHDATEFVSWVSMANRFHESGLWYTAEAVRSYLDTIFKLPLVASTSSGLGYTHYLGAFQPQRWSPLSNVWIVSTLRARVGSVIDWLEGHDALLKCLLAPSKDGHSLKLSPRRNSLSLRRKMVQPY